MPHSNHCKIVVPLGRLLILCLITSIGSFADEPAKTQKTQTETVSSSQRAHLAARALLSLYNKDSGLFDTTGWWNSANAITALADQSAVSKSEDYRPIFSNTFVRAQSRYNGFLNEFYDDEGWWALAWIDVYELEGNKRNLRMAQSIFKDMTMGWDGTCGGGIWWKKDRHYKNAIANELFLSVAARLALHTKGETRREYVSWAQREWKWFNASGMINHDGVINDGLNNGCTNNGGKVWSYNQGVILGALADLRSVSGDKDLLRPVEQIASSAIEHLTDSQGVLHDPCEPACGADGVQFKGIFARNLNRLNRQAPNPRYTTFFLHNADSVWNHARTPSNHFSAVWTGPPKQDGAGALTSALDVLVAASSIDSED